MEQKLNIAEILRNKPHGIRLYSPIFGDCTFCYIKDETNDICVRRPYNEMSYFNFEGLYNAAGECLLFPSRLMRNWSKFAWKKGDVLVSDNGKVEVIFEKFVDDTYQSFIGKHHLDNLEDNLYYQDEGEYLTSIFNTESEDAAQTYINTIEERLDGTLNRETLEIEKTQPEFKDGDILIYKSEKFTYFSSIFILNTNRNEISSYVRFSIGKGSIDYDVPVYNLGTDRFRYATEEEKQQLFSALAKEGKAWNTEKKQIVDLKPKVELKPFDKVLVRDSYDDMWRACFFSHIRKDGKYVTTSFTWKFCIPYEGNERLLGTTDDFE